MPDRRWLEQMREESLRRGLPPEYVERLAAELSDHLVDLREEAMQREAVCDDRTIEARLGEPGWVAGVAEAARGGLLRRSRLAAFAVFALLPVPALLLLWAAAGLLWYVAGALFVYCVEASGRSAAVETWISGQETGGVVLLRLLIVSAIAVPAAGLAAAYCLLSKRTGRSLLWAAVGCLVVAAASGVVRHQVTPPDAAGHGTVMIGVGTGAVSGWQLAQATAPAVVGLAFAWRQGRARGPLAA
ncbi:MAG TPA: hypothetical protein VF170_17565 [Planctomycetaceae bacterium]